MEIESLRERLLDLANLVEIFDKIVGNLATNVPDSPEREAMFDCRIPFDVPTEIFAVIETVREDYLGEAVTALRRAARTHQAHLEQRFRGLEAFPTVPSSKAPGPPERP